MRIACYNVEWFDRLFNDRGELLVDGGWSARYNVTRAQQAEALGIVFTALDADAILIVEAPDDHDKRSGMRALMSFAEAFDLRTDTPLIGFTNTTQQEISLLYDPYKLSARHDPRGTVESAVPRFDGSYRIDLDIDNRAEEVEFSKPPLELAIDTVNGTSLRMIGAHLKSKAPHGARNRDEVMQVSIANRRKQLAQAVWLRQRVDEHLAEGESVILLGDLNDGPGLDQYENLFGRSSVEILLGENGGPCLFDPNATRALGQKIGAAPTSARFYLQHEKRYLQALLDYIMISPDLRAKSPEWRIWHPFNDPVCWNTPELRDALVIASDHYPVTLDIDI